MVLFQKQQLKLLNSLLFIGASSCTDRNSLLSIDGSTPSPDVESSFFCPQGLTECLDICTHLDYDFSNCGSCTVVCQRADHCRDGECRCGDHQECFYPSECLNGQCIQPDIKGNVCEGEGDCSNRLLCVAGFCTSPECTEEICDGYDNDCDGQLDETPLELARICYTGPPGTANIGPCVYGLSFCLGGVYGPCIDERTPVEEVGILSCDGQDNDCNGCPDNFYGVDGECRPAIERQYDTVFYIDYSGSMSPYIGATIEAVEDLSESFAGNDSYHWALVGIPSIAADSAAIVIQDLTEYSIFSSSLLAEGTIVGAGACEPNRAGPILGENGSLDLSFRPGAIRLHIIFTDELAQGCGLLPIATEEIFCDTLRTAVIATVTLPQFYDEWDDCAITRELTRDGQEMADTLLDIFEEVCE